jgi:ATP-dependent Zn protease
LQIRMPRPDTGGRYDILRLQLASKDVSSDVDLLQLAHACAVVVLAADSHAAP